MERPYRRSVRFFVLSTFLLAAGLVLGCGKSDPVYEILSLTAEPTLIAEGEGTPVALTATYQTRPTLHSWKQVGGPAVAMTGHSSGSATLDSTELEVAGDTVVTIELTAMWETGSETEPYATDTATVDVVVQAVDVLPARAEGQIGGATIAATEIDQAGGTWALYNQGSRLQATLLGTSGGAVYKVDVGGYIQGIEVVNYGESRFALLSLGAEGIGVVDVTDVTVMRHVLTVGVNYEKLGVTFAEGGGAILVEDIVGTRSHIAALASDGTTLWIANADYGLQRTALSNLLDVAGPSLEGDGTLLIDAENYTQQYAGERAWGAPVSLTLFGGKIFAAQAFLGMGIFDPDTLEQVGRYNLYVDTTSVEDWFIDMDVTTQVQSDLDGPFVDAFTGMPDYRQTNFEIEQVWKNDVDAPTPWADFDRYGKYYYNSQDVAVADHGPRTIAYIAYGLGGLVAVDVSGFENATAGNFLTATYLGYAPGAPAHGPDEPRQYQSQSLYPYFGAGMLKEGGATSVAVDGDRVLYTDHFAGLVVLERADRPQDFWAQVGAPFDNDAAPGGGTKVLGDHWPDYEFVTSYDMSPYDPLDHESLPAWHFQAPALLTTGEVGGHGRAVVLLSGADTTAMGGTDVLLLAGAGGLSMADLDLSGMLFDDRFAVLRYVPSTDEVGAAVDGTPTDTIAIGHTQGITSTDGYLYVADGPHGISVWDILGDERETLDDPHVVANTLQDEYPQDDGTGMLVYPATHAWAAIYEESETAVYAMCQSVGMRRVSVVDVEAGMGTVGAPLLIAPEPTDIFEHNGDWGTVEDVQYQDHAYDVFRRDDLAFVADGSNGLTIYDVTLDPTDMMSGFVVGNVGATSQRPPLGRATGITFWSDDATGTDYAFLAAGQFGIGVVDVTDVTSPELVKVFQPIKYEDDKVGHADGRNVDVHVVGDHVFFSYTSFGLLSYTIADLIEPLPDGVDPTELYRSTSSGTLEFDYRPEHVARFKLTDLPGFEELDAEALYMEFTNIADRVLFYVAYGGAGVAVVDWTDAAAPSLLAHADTVHEATAVTLQNGRLYVADHDGGIAILK